MQYLPKRSKTTAPTPNSFSFRKEMSPTATCCCLPRLTVHQSHSSMTRLATHGAKPCATPPGATRQSPAGVLIVEGEWPLTVVVVFCLTGAEVAGIFAHSDNELQDFGCVLVDFHSESFREGFGYAVAINACIGDCLVAPGGVRDMRLPLPERRRCRTHHRSSHSRTPPRRSCLPETAQ